MPLRLARAAKARAIRFRKRHGPIAIFGLRRGGSTIVADMIAEEPGVWLANEPFAVLPTHPAYTFKREHLPERAHSHFFDLDPEEAARFEAYSHRLLAAAMPRLGTCRHTKPLLEADRVCLKILNAPWMIDWFARCTDCHVLPLLRHPGAQAMSVIRQGWGFPLEAYAARLGPSSSLLTPRQHHAIEQGLRSGDPWRIAVLDWAVVTKVMRDHFADQIVHYENIVAEPARFVDEILVGRFGLTRRDKILARIRRPSGSGKMNLGSTNTAIAEGRVDAAVNGWRSRVTPHMLSTGQAVLDLFEVDQYSFTQPDFTA